MKAIILAAGKGTRMLPLTENIPKVLVPVAGRPFLWYLLKNLQKAGITEFGIIIGYKQDMIKDFIEHENIPNVTFIEQKEQLGTGHAVFQAKEFAGNDKFIVISGDNLYSVADIQQVAGEQENTIAGLEVGNPSEYGVLVADENKLIRIDEKSENPVSNLINTGLYLFGPEIFEAIEKTGKSSRGEYELTDAMTSLAQEGKMFVYKLNNYWMDLGKLSDIPIVEAKIKEIFGSQV